MMVHLHYASSTHRTMMSSVRFFLVAFSAHSFVPDLRVKAQLDGGLIAEILQNLLGSEIVLLLVARTGVLHLLVIPYIDDTIITRQTPSTYVYSV